MPITVSSCKAVTNTNSIRTNPPQVMTMEELAQYLLVSRPTIDLYIKTQGLPVSRFGKTYRFYLSAVNAWIERNTRPLDDKTSSSNS